MVAPQHYLKEVLSQDEDGDIDLARKRAECTHSLMTTASHLIGTVDLMTSKMTIGLSFQADRVRHKRTFHDFLWMSMPIYTLGTDAVTLEVISIFFDEELVFKLLFFHRC